MRGFRRRRLYRRRRFGVGGGNRKRPSSYSIAYGFTKQFDIVCSKELTPTDYENPATLAYAALLALTQDVNKGLFEQGTTIARLYEPTHGIVLPTKQSAEF